MTDTSDTTAPSVLIALDIEDPSLRPLEIGLTAVTRWPGARAHVLYVGPDPRTGGHAASSLLTVWEHALAQAPERLRSRVRVIAQQLLGDHEAPPIALHVRLGDPAAVILQTAIDVEADAIVVGTHDHKGIARVVLGSVAQEVAQSARCAVVVARQPSYAGLAKTPRIEPAAPAHDPGPSRAVHVYTFSEEVPWNRPSVIR